MTAIAGLESGTIDTDTYITDRGKYTYYSDYQPTCLVYSSSGATHGTIDVSEAIGVSCNYFFYDIGRKMGIDTMVDYSRKLGLGEATGLELPESTGVVASPGEREERGGEWAAGRCAPGGNRTVRPSVHPGSDSKLYQHPPERGQEV